MEYDIPYPTYIPYIGPYNAPLGVKCQGRVVTCFNTEKGIIPGVWLGSTVANAPSSASSVQVGEVRVIGARSSCLRRLPFFCPSKTGALITNHITVPQPVLARTVRPQRHLRCARNESTLSLQALAGETRRGVPC